MNNVPSIYPRLIPVDKVKSRLHRRRVLMEMRDLGVSRPAMHSMEARYMPHIIHDNEHIGGITYGLNDGSFAMLVATDWRIIYLDRKPLFTDEDEVAYSVVSGIDFGSTGIGATLTLHTRIKDYVMRTLNDTAARGFVNYIESRCLEQPQS